MIYVTKLNKKYNEKYLYKDLTFNFEDTGFYGILGESGSGKSTLLNMMSSLDNDYDGKIEIDGVDLATFKEKDRRNYRLNNFGFIFQNYALLQDETVLNNVKLVQDSLKHLTKEIRKQNLEEVLKYLEIYDLKDKLVKNLSGGEKQRVAIARAIINKPKIIFCDEPTGALDEANSLKIFEILKELSKSSLVIVVSHDGDLIRRFSNYIIDLKTFRMEKNKEVNHSKNDIKILNKAENNSRGSIRFDYIFRNIKSTFKSNKMRYFVSGLVFSIALVCLGLTIFISDNVSRGISKAFGAIVNENSLVLTKKNADENLISYSCSKDDISSIFNNYDDEIDYIGCKYLVNFPSFFKDEDEVYFSKGGLLHEITFLSSTSFNEFYYLDNYTRSSENFYPTSSIKNELDNDEIILSLDYLSMEKLCFELQIVRSYEALGDYLETNNLSIILRAANYSRNYEDEQIFTLKGVFPSSQNKIYHTNMFFNEFVFEDSMSLPSTHDIFNDPYYPWTIKKVFYFKSKNFQTNLINTLLKDERYKNYIFDVDNNVYSPSVCKANEPCFSNRIFAYKTLNDIFSYKIIDDIYKINPKFDSYYYSTYFGYLNIGASLFNGFSSNMYFAKDETSLRYIENTLENIEISKENELILPDNIANGYYLNTSANNVKYTIKKDGKYRGSAEFLYNEVGISTSLASKLYKEEDPLNKDIYLMLNTSKISDGEMNKNTFRIVKLKVTAIVESDKFQIYQEKEFSINLFRDFFEISSFNLIPNSIVYEFDEKPTSAEIEMINKSFKDYELVDPYSPIEESVDEVFNYFNIGLIIFTVFSFLSSSILLFVINTINLEEEKRTLAILMAIGFNNFEISKMETMKNFAYLLPSIIGSAISLSFISYFVGGIISSLLGLSLTYSLPILSILGVSGLAILLTIISFIFLIIMLHKKDIIKNLH